MQRIHNLDEAKEYFARLSLRFEADAALRHQNGNIEVENFFRDLLNLLFNWSLDNANWSGATNHDSFDLADHHKRIAVQVTSTTSAAKIRKTLETFIPTHCSAFDRLLFVYPSMSKTASTADFSTQLCGFPFDSSRDRLDLSDLLKAIQNLAIEQQTLVMSLLRRELGALAAALQMGVDRNVEAIISIIRYMSQGSLTSELLPEMKPDAARKMARFHEHAEFLKRQFKAHVECYGAVEEARRAVGYDAVRAARCNAWLQERSISALEEHGGDARKAFNSLVEHLCSRERQAGRDYEETAVRYFLADELFRCNVFPNQASQNLVAATDEGAPDGISITDRTGMPT